MSESSPARGASESPSEPSATVADAGTDSMHPRDASAGLDASRTAEREEQDAGTESGAGVATTPFVSLVGLADPSCLTPGCLRSARLVGDYTTADIQPYLEHGVQIENGYSVIVVEYATRDATSLATVTIPFPRRAADYAYPIVANAHGTVGLDDPCTLSGTTYGTGHSGLFGARGAIGIAPDYPGLGTPGLHRYLVSESTGSAVLDSLRAATTLAEKLGLVLSRRYAVVGSSEGGHAALAAAAQHAAYAPELDIRAFAAAAPANMWFEQWSRAAKADGSHLPYHAMLFYAWADYYQYAGPRIWADGVAPRIDTIMRENCSFDFGHTRGTYLEALGEAAQAIFAPDFWAAYQAGDLGSTYKILGDAFVSNRVGPYRQTAPLTIWQGDADAVVLEADTASVVADLRAGGVEVDYRVVATGTHTGTAFGMLGQWQLATEESVAWILRQLR